MARPVRIQPHRQRLNALEEPERSIAWKEFNAALPTYGLDENLLPVDLPDKSDKSDKAIILTAEYTAEGVRPRDVFDSTLDKLAEVSVWAAQGFIERITED